MTRPERSQVSEIGPDAAFECEHCGEVVSGTVQGTKNRNHCPLCLWSLHVDLQIGDRRAACRGQMEPISIWVLRNGEWRIVHRCGECGMMRANRIASDDNELLLMSMATGPLAQPPFPLDRLGVNATNND